MIPFIPIPPALIEWILQGCPPQELKGEWHGPPKPRHLFQSRSVHPFDRWQQDGEGQG